MDIRELVRSVKFHVNKKETYSVDDVYAQEEQLKTKIGSELDAVFKDTTSKFESQIEALKTELEEKKTSFESIEKSLEDKTSESIKQKEELESVGKELKVFKTESDKRSAKELLEGLVAQGAEVDVYNKMLGEELTKFEDGISLEEKREKVSTHLKSIIEQKPYLAPAKKDGGSNNSLVEKTKLVDTSGKKTTEGEAVKADPVAEKRPFGRDVEL